jgi:hypothetical protein
MSIILDSYWTIRPDPSHDDVPCNYLALSPGSPRFAMSLIKPFNEPPIGSLVGSRALQLKQSDLIQ